MVHTGESDSYHPVAMESSVGTGDRGLGTGGLADWQTCRLAGSLGGAAFGVLLYISIIGRLC